MNDFTITGYQRYKAQCENKDNFTQEHFTLIILYIIYIILN